MKNSSLKIHSLTVLIALFVIPLVSQALAAKGKTFEIGSVGEQMLYDKTLLEVKAGEAVTVTMKNNSTSPVMEHNWVLVVPGKEMAVTQAGIMAGAAAHWFAKTPDVLAFTAMTPPGKTATVHFKAPAKPGDYPYLCTFPGHYPMMKGTLKVTP